MTGYVRHRSYRRKSRRTLRKRTIRFRRRKTTIRRRGRRRPMRKSRIAKLTRKVAIISKRQGNLMGRQVQRTHLFGTLAAPQRQAKVLSLHNNSNLSIEDFINPLKWFDPTNPGTRLNVNFNAGTIQKEILIDRMDFSLTIKANYLIGCQYDIYLCMLKSDTDLTPEALYTTGITLISNATVSNPLMYPTDVPLLKDIWSTKRVKSGILRPGQQVTCFHRSRPFSYDPSLSDNQTELYQVRFRSMAYLLRIHGLIAHDSMVGDQQGLAPAQVDWMTTDVLQCRYNAGAKVLYYETAGQGGDTFTNNGIVTYRPAAANQFIAIE